MNRIAKSIGNLKKFIQNQSHNYIILLIRGVFASFFNQLVQNFSNIYVIELGATSFQLSEIRSIGSAVNALISIPMGWICDLYSIKRLMIMGMIVQIAYIAFYAFAQNWYWIIGGAILASLTMTLVYRIQMIYIANSLKDSNRATGYGMRTTIIQAFSIIAPTIGGYLVHIFGGISVEGIRPLYYIQLIGYIILTIYVSLKIEDIKIEKKEKIKNFLKNYAEMLKKGVHMKRFVLLQALGSITWGMSMPFIFVYASEIKMANSITIGYMGTCLTFISMLMAIPLGNLADRKGRKYTIYLTRPFFWGSYILLMLAPPGNPIPLLLAWAMRGVMMASSAWTTLSMEMVPQEYRGRWTGFNSLFQNMIRAPAILIGGYIYENMDPSLIFIIPIIVDILIRIPILMTVSETLKRE